MDWIAYFDDDGTIGSITSEEGGPADVPPFGTGIIGQADPDVGWTLLHRPDAHYFVHVEGRGWNHCDIWGLVDHLANFPGCIVRMGRGIPNPWFKQLHEYAILDPRRPDRSGRSPREPVIPERFLYRV